MSTNATSNKSINSQVDEEKVVLSYDEMTKFESELKTDEKLVQSDDDDTDTDSNVSSSSSSNNEFPYLDLLILDHPDKSIEASEITTFSIHNSNNEVEQTEKENDSDQTSDIRDHGLINKEKNEKGKEILNSDDETEINDEDNDIQIDIDERLASTVSTLKNKMKKITGIGVDTSSENTNENDLKQLMSANEWKQVSELLRKERKNKTIFFFEFKCNDTCTSSHGLLHYACRCGTIPYSIIKEILKVCPDDVYEMDCSNRNALHIAVENSLPIEIIAKLVKKNPRAAQQACSIGNTPLHWAVLAYKQNQLMFAEENHDWNTSSYTVIEYHIKLFKLLTHVAPDTIKAKNCVGDTPFEIVLRDRDNYTNTVLDIFWKADTSSTRKSSMKQYGSLQVERIKDASGGVMFKFKRVVTPNPYSVKDLV